MNSSVPLSLSSMRLKTNSFFEALQITFEVSVILEQTQFSDPIDLVATLQSQMTSKLVSPTFTEEFISTCIEMGSVIDHSFHLLFGNITFLPDVSVVIVKTSAPTSTPLKRHPYSTNKATLPRWSYIMIGLGVLGVLISLVALNRRKQLTDHQLKIQRYREKEKEGELSKPTNEESLTLPPGWGLTSLLGDEEEVRPRDVKGADELAVVVLHTEEVDLSEDVV